MITLPREGPIPPGTLVTLKPGLTGTAMSQSPGMVSPTNPITGTLRSGSNALVIGFMAREKLRETLGGAPACTGGITDWLDEALVLSVGPLARLGWVAAHDLVRV